MDKAWRKIGDGHRPPIVDKLEKIKDLLVEIKDLQLADAKDKVEALEKAIKAKLLFKKLKADRNDLAKENANGTNPS